MVAGPAGGDRGRSSNRLRPRRGHRHRNRAQRPGKPGHGHSRHAPRSQDRVLNLAFYNHSGAPLTITNVTVTGRGIGTVARVTEVKIAPARYDPGGLYVTDPPVYHFLHPSRLGPVGCNVQALLPPGNPRGFHNLYIWAVVEMIRPGTYRSLGSTVHYTPARDPVPRLRCHRL